MKPPGNLTRYTPLARGVALQRRTPLERGKGLARSPFPRHQSQQATRKPARKRPGRVGEGKARELVYARSGGCCEVQLPGICLGPGMNWHHILDRKHGGPWAAWNGLHVCGSGSPGHGCHGTLTTPPPGRAGEFERNGWTAQAASNPRGRTVLVPRQLVCPDDQDCPDDAQARVLLTDDGRYLLVGEVAR